MLIIGFYEYLDTIADLEKSEQVKQVHLAEALDYQQLERMLILVVWLNQGILLLILFQMEHYRLP